MFDEPDAVQQSQRLLIASDDVPQRPAAGGGRVVATGRTAADDHRQAAEALAGRALEQLEPRTRVAREHGRGAPGERSGDRPLGSRLGLERGECQALAGIGQRPRSRRNSLALGDRRLERAETVTGRAGSLRDVVALGGGGARDRSGLVRLLLELCRRRAAAACELLCLGELAAQALDKGSGGLGAQRQPLASATECDQPAGGTVVTSGRLGKSSFDLASVRADRGEALFGRRRAAPFQDGKTRVCEPGSFRRVATCLGSFPSRRSCRGGRLLERPEPFVAAVGRVPLHLEQLLSQARL